MFIFSENDQDMPIACARNNYRVMPSLQKYLSTSLFALEIDNHFLFIFEANIIKNSQNASECGVKHITKPRFWSIRNGVQR